MTKLIAVLAIWLLRKLGVLVVILAVLLAGAWISGEWVKLREARKEIEQKEELQAGLESDLAFIDGEISKHRADWQVQRQRVLEGLEGEIGAIDRQIEQAGRDWGGKIAEFGDLEKVAAKARAAATKAALRRDALEGQVGALDRGLYFLSDEARRKVNAYETAKAGCVALEETARLAERARDRLGSAIRNSPVHTLNERKRRKLDEVAQAQRAVSTEELEMMTGRERKEAEIAAVESLLEAQRERIAKDPRQRFVAAVQAQLPLAAWILLGIVLMPVAIKGFMYYVLGPLAEKLPAIRVLPAGDAPPVPEPEPSSVSVPFDIGEGEEILVHSDFLQSSSQPSFKRTQWFLNPRMPISSIASGMCILTRIQPAEDVTTRVVLSSQNDAFGEIGVIEIPQGAAMVVHPRSLAGIVKRQDEPVHISRHWRLFSLHAWFTLQLRYLAFHGPCKLVLKGCRGVRAEEPDPDKPRMINQAATIGFSANLEYKNTRCETFISYLRGKEDLFNDLFGGSDGRFVYEEMPNGGRKTGLVGRGLEGALDAALKVFGI